MALHCFSMLPYPNSQLANQKPSLLPDIQRYQVTDLISHDIIGFWAEIPNRTSFIRFGVISGSFGLAMGVLTELRLVKIRTMARPNSPDMPPKRIKNVRLGIIIFVP